MRKFFLQRALIPAKPPVLERGVFVEVVDEAERYPMRLTVGVPPASSSLNPHAGCLQQLVSDLANVINSFLLKILNCIDTGHSRGYNYSY